MLEDLRLSKHVTMRQILDGRLARFGIRQCEIHKGSNGYPADHTCCLTDGLTDGHNCVEVVGTCGLTDGVVGGPHDAEGQDIRVTKLTPFRNDPDHILNAIAETFDVELFSCNAPQFWRYEPISELYAEHLAQTKENRDEYYSELIKYAREEPTGISRGSAAETLAQIATLVIMRRLKLIDPDAKEELFKAMVNELFSGNCPEKFGAWTDGHRPRDFLARTSTECACEVPF